MNQANLAVDMNEQKQMMDNVVPFNTRTILRDGKPVYQRRLVTCEVKFKWYKPWKMDIGFDASEWYDADEVSHYTFRIGDRVQARPDAGFHKGATGEVKFVEPNGKKVWVLRDTSRTPVYYHHDELELIWRPVDEQTA